MTKVNILNATELKVGLRQGCMMSLSLFKIFTYGVVQEVNARVLWRGLRLNNKKI